MKCILNLSNGEASRVNNKEAHNLVSKGTHRYCAKSVWKKEVRNQKNTPKKKGGSK